MVALVAQIGVERGIAFELLSRGVIMIPCGRNGNVVRIMPSLTIPRSYLFAALDTLLDVLARR